MDVFNDRFRGCRSRMVRRLQDDSVETIPDFPCTPSQDTEFQPESLQHIVDKLNGKGKKQKKSKDFNSVLVHLNQLKQKISNQSPPRTPTRSSSSNQLVNEAAPSTPYAMPDVAYPSQSNLQLVPTTSNWIATPEVTEWDWKEESSMDFTPKMEPADSDGTMEDLFGTPNNMNLLAEIPAFMPTNSEHRMCFESSPALPSRSPSPQLLEHIELYFSYWQSTRIQNG